MVRDTVEVPRRPRASLRIAIAISLANEKRILWRLPIVRHARYRWTDGDPLAATIPGRRRAGRGAADHPLACHGGRGWRPAGAVRRLSAGGRWRGALDCRRRAECQAPTARNTPA